MSIAVKSLNHIAYSVNNLDETKEWYQRVFDIPVIEDYDPNSCERHLSMKFPDFEIEFFEYVDDSESNFPTFNLPEDHFNHREKRQWHFSLEVADLKKAEEQCHELGLEIIAVFDNGCFFIMDPNNKLVELKQIVF
jgi:catechol 2,3-dioxygenase-like lactoylglutathione lyase family enzyme